MPRARRPGISAQRIEEVDLSPAVRARDATPPGGDAEVEALGKRLSPNSVS